ncbi:MAG: 3-oxoacyl-[acyl-carrier-protein] reductase FabG [Calditrichaeota bacterium]|nr:3-oxoacyl-[acyl-carrier-protein] reductase FabG [Calditrichota bacterium]
MTDPSSTRERSGDPFALASLAGEVVWVTGASGGLGPGICRCLHEAAGVALAVHGFRARSRLNALAEELRAAGANVLPIMSDLAEPGSAERAIGRIVRRLGAPYALIHLAGPYVRKPAVDHSRAEFNRMIGGNLTSFFEAARSVVWELRKRAGGGRIIAIGMHGAQHTTPMREHGPHLAAKAALTAFARTLALEEAANGITVNVINPGHIWKKTLEREQARREPAGAEHPIGAHGSYEDIADAILYLLSPAASYVTGAVLDVSGGWRPGG